MALQHGGTELIQFVLQPLDHVGVVVSDVVDAVSREEIEDAPAIRREKFRSEASFIRNVHFQDVQQRDPLRVYVTGIRRRW